LAVGVKFMESNGVLGAPTPEEADTVYGLPVRIYKDLDGRTNVLSKWELTEDEKAEVARTGVVWFNAQGRTHPPIWISGHDPFRGS
jgi:hypothetical protein